MQITTQSEAETIRAATDFADILKPGDIVLLNGDLGMGKSVFSRAIIRALAQNQDLDVPSPTFTLVQTYDTPQGEVYHFDLYRLKAPDELYEIGWEDAVSSGILLVEWPDRLGYLRPQTPISVSISRGSTPDSRLITLERS
jgi:tRNA threonylcarbamoyl adenosine modification protein YjeE